VKFEVREERNAAPLPWKSIYSQCWKWVWKT